jgi:hypothetical protein
MQLQCAVNSTAPVQSSVTKLQWTTSNQGQVVNSSNPLKRTAELGDKVTTKEDEETIMYNKTVYTNYNGTKNVALGFKR